jgi:hypothetical protein
MGTDLLALRRKIEALSSQLDERYFKLSDETGATTAEALRVFRKARAAAALAFSLTPDARQLHEAIYEAVVASDDREQAMRAAEEALSAK